MLLANSEQAQYLLGGPSIDKRSGFAAGARPQPPMKKLVSILFLASLCSCAGMRTTGSQTTVHAESFNLLGLQIPHNDHAKAWEMVPEGAEVVTAVSTPGDLGSLAGILARIFGFTGTQISYTMPE